MMKSWGVFLVFYLLSGPNTSNKWWMCRPYQHFGASAAAVPGDVPKKKTRILYVVSSLNQFNRKKSKVTGKDRLEDLVLPVLVDSIESFTVPPFSDMYEVDVYFISAYKLPHKRKKEIRDQLPVEVGLEIWDGASPTAYDKKHPNQNKKNALIDHFYAFGRQHRYVVKDKLAYYDLFLAFEDGMRVTANHVQHFLEMSDQIETLRIQAPDTWMDVPEDMEPDHQKYFGAMIKDQIDRVIPGFIRAEVLLDPKEHGSQKELDPIPLNFTEGGTEEHFNPRYCCHVQMTNKDMPVHPEKESVVIWETSVKALSVRQMPQSRLKNKYDENLIDWIGLLPGPKRHLKTKEKLGGYWSGRDGAYGDVKNKPSAAAPDLLAPQGGWMATRDQLLRMQDHCMGNFLPPFDDPIFKKDGQETDSLDYWSGGFQLYTGLKGGCNMQRIVSLTSADAFSKHFLYHVDNDKQSHIASKRVVLADNLWGQLKTLVGKAKALQNIYMSEVHHHDENPAPW